MLYLIVVLQFTALESLDVLTIKHHFLKASVILFTSFKFLAFRLR